MLIYYERGKRKWFIRPKSVPNAFFPAARPDENTLTASLFADASAEDGTGETRADYLFEHPKANRYYLRESCFRTSADSVVTLLWWDDEEQIINLEEQEERNAVRRSDERWGSG